MERKAIVTMPPYATYINEILSHPRVSGIRLNTVMPIKETYYDVIKRLQDICNEKEKDFWIDLKCRQLRTTTYATPPFTEIELSHEIELYTPTKAYFSSRSESATILEVNKRKLIMQDGPKRVVGPGESITIPHPTLKIKGNLTDTDKKYIEAGNKSGVNKYMLSFVENNRDIIDFRSYTNKVQIVEKIESQKGLEYVKHKWKTNNNSRLMAARGDLYMELHWPHMITRSLENILEKDKYAIVASRILDSMELSPEPSCADIGDLDNILRMGYQEIMFGDEVCLKRESIISALNVFSAMAENYEK